MIDIEIQNETLQTNERVKFAVVPRIGEGVRLQEPNGFWASYDILDLWYQKAEYGDVWVPYLHVRKTAAEGDAVPLKTHPHGANDTMGGEAGFDDKGEVVPFTI